MNTTATSIIIAGLLIGGAIIFTASRGNSDGEPTGGDASVDNVSIVDGKQVVIIDAKGGYFPRITAAKAGVPTIIKVNTSGTFDCSSFLVIPKLDYRKNLPLSGETLVEVPSQEAGSTLQGLCSMGMYNFQIRFE